MALGRNLRQRIEPDRTLGIAGVEITDRMGAVGGDAIRDRLGKVAVRVDDGDPFPAMMSCMARLNSVVLFPEPDLPTM